MKRLTLLLLLLLLGCAGKSTQERQAQLCGHLTTLDETVVNLRRIQQSATAAAAAWRDAEQQADSAFAAVKTTATAQGANLSELEAAYSDLDQTIQALPQQLSGGQSGSEQPNSEQPNQAKPGSEQSGEAALDPSAKAQMLAALSAKLDAVKSASLQLSSRLNCGSTANP
jgi:hypothetical protein